MRPLPERTPQMKRSAPDGTDLPERPWITGQPGQAAGADQAASATLALPVVAAEAPRAAAFAPGLAQ